MCIYVQRKALRSIEVSSAMVSRQRALAVATLMSGTERIATRSFIVRFMFSLVKKGSPEEKRDKRELIFLCQTFSKTRDFRDNSEFTQQDGRRKERQNACV